MGAKSHAVGEGQPQAPSPFRRGQTYRVAAPHPDPLPREEARERGLASLALFTNPENWQTPLMTTITLDKAQSDHATLVERALAGEEIVIEMPNAATVKLSPVELPRGFDQVTARLRGYGSMKGELVVGPEFFEPLPEDELALWVGRGDD